MLGTLLSCTILTDMAQKVIWSRYLGLGLAEQILEAGWWQEEWVGKGARPESSSISQSLNYGALLDFMI